MERKLIGLVMMAFGILIILISVSFTLEFMARGNELHNICTLPSDICPFLVPPWQGFFLIGIGALFVILGVFFVKKPESSRPAIDSSRVDENLKKLEGEEKLVYQLAVESRGIIFQGKLIEKTGFSKVRISRILDGMESKGLLERRRRGMSNVIVLK